MSSEPECFLPTPATLKWVRCISDTPHLWPEGLLGVSLWQSGLGPTLRLPLDSPISGSKLSSPQILAMTTNATTQVSIVPPSDDGKSLTPPLTSANANGGSAATATGEYQILRLKRKRNEEPLDGLRRHPLTRHSELQTRLT